MLPPAEVEMMRFPTSSAVRQNPLTPVLISDFPDLLTAMILALVRS